MLLTRASEARGIATTPADLFARSRVAAPAVRRHHGPTVRGQRPANLVIWSLSKQDRKKPAELAARCEAYLRNGPPPHMTHHVPESLTEVLIAHGARRLVLDDEMPDHDGAAPGTAPGARAARA